jgi:hypothetical protein
MTKHLVLTMFVAIFCGVMWYIVGYDTAMHDAYNTCLDGMTEPQRSRVWCLRLVHEQHGTDWLAQKWRP